MKRQLPLPRSMRAPSARAVADGARIVALLYGRRRVNVEDRGLVEGMAIDALHRIAVAEFLRCCDGIEGTKRYRGTRGTSAAMNALAAALVAYACVDLKPETHHSLVVELTAASYPAIGRGYQVFMRGEEQREAQRRGARGRKCHAPMGMSRAARRAPARAVRRVPEKCEGRFEHVDSVDRDDKAACPICGKRVGGYVPRGGDGTQYRLRSHKPLKA